MPTENAEKMSDCCTYCRAIFFEGRCAWCMFDAVRGTTNDINALGVVLEELKKYSRYFEIELDGGQTLSPRRIKHRWDDDLVLRQRHREDYLVSFGAVPSFSGAWRAGVPHHQQDEAEHQKEEHDRPTCKQHCCCAPTNVPTSCPRPPPAITSRERLFQ